MSEDKRVHITVHPPQQTANAADLIAAQQLALVDAHRRGEHTYGNMRRNCPLCNRS